MIAVSRSAAAVATILSLTGCLSITVNQARIDADLPFAPPAAIPDSVEPGDGFIQASLKVGPTDFPTEDVQWKTDPVGGSIQAQLVRSSHLRSLAGIGYGGGPSAWLGMAWSTRNAILRWDVEALVGVAYSKTHLEGTLNGSEDDGTRVHEKLPVVDRRFVSGWSQFALRVRSRRSGPWAEWRILPGYYVGELADPGNRIEAKSVTTATGSVAAGWISEFANHDMAIVGIRAVNFEQSSTRRFQFLGSWQKAF